MGSVVELEIPPRRDHLALVRQVVTTAATIGHPLAARRLEDLRLAVSEACANAIDGEERVGTDAALHLRIEVDADAVVVTVVDHAGGFVPPAPTPLPVAAAPDRLRQERGLGLPLMRSLADDVRFTATVDGTAVRLEVRRTAD